MKPLIILLLLIPVLSYAQSDANKVLCYGQQITLNAVDTLPIHQWYKVINGSPILQSQTGKTYTETPTTSGYYNYQMVNGNSTGCTSPISDVLKVFVLPNLTPSISSPISSVCSATQLSGTLITNVPTGYAYTYQWYLNGTAIPGANVNSYSLSGVAATGTYTFSVNVYYSLNPSCVYTATKTFTVVPSLSKPTVSFRSD